MNADVNEQLHAFIKNGEIQNVEQWLTHFSTNSYDKFLRNRNEDSAVATALRNGRIEFYSLLLDKGFKLTPFEHLERILEQISSHISEDDKEKIRKIHHKHAQDPKIKYVNILIEKSKVSHDGDNTKLRRYIGLISQAFHELNENEWIVPILKVVSQAENLSIVFDFARKSTEVMVPTTGSNTNGIVFPGEGNVYVGAKDLWKNVDSSSLKPLEDIAREYSRENEDRSKVCGVIAHELCHYAMQLLYRNDCKPYFEKDTVMSQKFDHILRFCKDIANIEGIIDVVFVYNLGQWHAELIVRVPHLLAHYKEYPDNVEDMKATFNPLFDFYEKTTLVDLERTFPLMEAMNKVKELNRKFGLSESLKENTEISFRPEILGEISRLPKIDEVSVFKSNCPQLTMKAIYQIISSDVDFEYKNILIRQKTLDIRENREKVLKALESCAELWLFIDCSEKPYEDNAMIDNFEEAKNRQIVFVHQSKSNGSDENVTHLWGHLTDETQNQLVLKVIDFQGEKLRLRETLPFNSTAMTKIPMNKLFLNQIKIGKNLEKIEEFTVVRKIEPTLDIDDAPRVVILSNEPGMGKTTEWKLMAKRIKEAYAGNWVVLMDLKQFFEAYEKDGKVKATFESPEIIAEYFCTKILSIKDFEADVFSQLLNEGRVFFLMDGFDEISPSFKEFNIILMSAIIKTTQNRVWISTRSHLEEELKEKMEQNIVYKLMPMDKNDRNELIRKRLESKNFNGENLESKLKKIEKILLNLEKKPYSRKDSVLSSDLLNPLLLSMVLEVFEEKEETFFSNQLNMFTLYQTFIDKTITTYTKKGYEAEQQNSKFTRSSVDIMKQFTSLALRNFLGDFKFSVIELNQNESQISDEELARVGLVTLGPNNAMEFVHRTYLEYFIADFIFRQILIGCESSRKYLRIFKNGFKRSDIKMIENFFNDAVSQKFDLLVKNHIKLKEINEMLSALVVKISIWRGLKYIFVLQIECKKNMFLEEDLSVNPFYKETEVFDDLVETIFKKCSPEQCEKFLSFITEIRGKEYVQSLLLKVDILRCSLKNKKHKDMFQYVLHSKQIQDILTTEKCMEIKLRCKSDTNVLKAAFASGRGLEFLTWFKENFSYFELNELFTESFVFWYILIGWDKNVDLIQWLKENFTRSDLRSMFFHVKHVEYYFKILECFDDIFENDEERKSFLLTEDKDGGTSFHCEALRTYCRIEIFDKAIETFNRLCGEDAMRNTLLKKHLTNGNILQRFLGCGIDSVDKKIKSLWNYMTTLFDKPTLKNFLLESNEQRNAFITELEYYPILAEFFKPFIRENITRQELQTLLSDSIINLLLISDITFDYSTFRKLRRIE